jgi:hypothetical protein
MIAGVQFPHCCSLLLTHVKSKLNLGTDRIEKPAFSNCSIVACVDGAAETCIPSHCLAMAISPGYMSHYKLEIKRVCTYTNTKVQTNTVVLREFVDNTEKYVYTHE